MSYLNLCFLPNSPPRQPAGFPPLFLKERGDVRKRTWGELGNNTIINCSHYLIYVIGSDFPEAFMASSNSRRLTVAYDDEWSDMA
jgi:hypothetical protein